MFYICTRIKLYNMTELKRIGNWYKVSIDEVSYNVLIQREPNSIVCEPSSVIVLDDELNVMDSSIHNQVQEIMEKVDWKYDTIDED